MTARLATITIPSHPAGQIRRSTTNLVAGAMWAASLVALVQPIPAPVTEGLVLVAMALTATEISRALRLPLLVCAAILLASTLSTGNLAPLLAGLDFAAPLAGFLVSVGVLRASLIGGASGAIARGRLDALQAAGQRSAILLLSFVLSAVFLVGVFPLLSPLITTRDRHDTDRLAAAALCGGALSFLWSPFSVGTAFSTATVGIAAGPGVTAVMFAIALCGLAVGLLLHGSLEVSVLRQTTNVARPLVLPLGLAIAATLLATLALSLRVTQVVPLVAPLVIALLALRPEARHVPAGGPLQLALRALPECGGALKDLTVYVVGFALARALTDSGIFLAVTHAVLGLSIGGAVPATLVLLTLVLGLLGVPAMVCAGLVAASSALLLGSAPPIVRLILTSYAWSSASMLSVTSGTLTVVASTFGVALRPLVLGRNMLAIVVFGSLVAALAQLVS